MELMSSTENVDLLYCVQYIILFNNCVYVCVSQLVKADLLAGFRGVLSTFQQSDWETIFHQQSIKYCASQQ